MIVIAAPRLPWKYPFHFDFTCSVGSLLTGEVRYVQGNSDCALGAPLLNDVRSLLVRWSLYRSCDRDDETDWSRLRRLSPRLGLADAEFLKAGAV